MMSKKIGAYLFLALLSHLHPMQGWHPKQDACYCHPLQFERHQAFDKQYVDNTSIVCTPHGIHYKRPDGTLEKVKLLSEDCKGKYVLRIYSQCSHCGKVYYGTSAPEGWSCLEN